MPGWRKFRLSVHRKNEERKRWKPKMVVKIPRELLGSPTTLPVSIPLCSLPAPENLIVSLPVSAYISSEVETSQALYTRLARIDLPQSWYLAASNPLTLCKVRLHPNSAVNFTLTISEHLLWTISVFTRTIDYDAIPSAASLSLTLTNVDMVIRVLKYFDSCRLCSGNSEDKLLSVWDYKSKTSHGVGTYF